MALEKVNYEDKKTVISAKNLNDIQDAVIALEKNKSGITDEGKGLVLSLIRNAAYTADMSAIFAQLEALWGGSGEGGGDTGGDSGGNEPDIPDVPEHTHSYTSAVTKEATCETAGVRTYTCSCGHSYTQAIPATGHNYVDGVCTVCGAADPDFVEKLNVTIPIDDFFVGGSAVSPTTNIVNDIPYSKNNSARLSYVGKAIAATLGKTYTATFNAVENHNLQWAVQWASKDVVDALGTLNDNKTKGGDGWQTGETHSFTVPYEAYVWLTIANVGGNGTVDKTKIVSITVTEV